jgi:hypothetical protein
MAALGDELPDVEFEWDPVKARRNELAHGVSFAEAITVLLDPLAVTGLDPKPNAAGEERFITMGVSHRQRVLVVVHCERGEKMRIISARKATPRERSDYAEA